MIRGRLDVDVSVRFDECADRVHVSFASRELHRAHAAERERLIGRTASAATASTTS
jgi:hypothetical protein